MSRKLKAPDIAEIGFHPPGGYRFDVELIELSDLRRRVSAEHLRAPQRVNFHLLLYFSAGRAAHLVDFETLPCRAGSLLVLSPGQVQRYDATATQWDGWLVIFRPEFLFENASTIRDDHEGVKRLADLAVHRTLRANERRIVEATLAQMAADARSAADIDTLQPLLHYQLRALIARLHLWEVNREVLGARGPADLERFRRFRLAVERHLDSWHLVADYARHLGTSTRSLERAASSIAGVSAKTYLSRRITLEAKRLLVHTTEPIARIAERLGFDEATNFVKFFRREAGQTPGAFRRHHIAE